jgi:N-methylhydantoinase B
MRSKIEKQRMAAGDALSAASPGGGGFGDPLTRDLAMIERDLDFGYISRETAEDVYGAVVRTEPRPAGRTRYTVDRAASEARRARKRDAATRPVAAG